jgi:hypothetical protein
MGEEETMARVFKGPGVGGNVIGIASRKCNYVCDLNVRAGFTVKKDAN